MAISYWHSSIGGRSKLARALAWAVLLHSSAATFGQSPQGQGAQQPAVDVPAEQRTPQVREAERSARLAPVPLGEGPWEYQTEQERIRVTLVTKGLDHPWGMAFLPNGDMLVTERPGRLRVIRNGALDPTPIGGLPELEPAVIGGLLDVALHPDFERNRLVYFAYSKPKPGDSDLTTTAVARGRWDGGPNLTNVADIWVADLWYGQALANSNNRCCGQGPPGGSYGSRILFDDEGYLYITSGDRNWGEKAQDPNSHLGKIIRVRDDGSIPRGNPFVGRDAYRPDIYSLGHRNPLGLTIHPVTRELWSTEFGPRGGDELNKIEAGKNYGWILVTQGKHYNEEPTKLGKNSVLGMTDPVAFWDPSVNPGNLVFYAGDAFPAWRGDLLMAAMSRTLLRLELDENGKPGAQEPMLTELGQRLRDVREGSDGLLYVLTDETEGAMLRIEPAR